MIAPSAVTIEDERSASIVIAALGSSACAVVADVGRLCHDRFSLAIHHSPPPCDGIHDFQSDRLANVFVILAYAPFLLFLPVLLLGGVVFVVVPGGFIIVLGGLYYAATGFAGLLGLAANSRWRARASRAPRANTTFGDTTPAGRAPSRPRGAIAPSPIAVPLMKHRVIGSPPSLVPPPRGLGDVDPLRTLDGGSAPKRLDGARPTRRDAYAHPASSGSESRA